MRITYFVMSSEKPCIQHTKNLKIKLFLSVVYGCIDWLQSFLQFFYYFFIYLFIYLFIFIFFYLFIYLFIFIFYFLLFFFCHSVSLPIAVFVSLIPFHCFTTETTLSFPLRDITYQIIISCTRLYTFEKKRENDRKDRVWRQTNGCSKHTENRKRNRSRRVCVSALSGQGFNCYVYETLDTRL